MPWNHFQIDLIGLLPVFKNTFCYILTVIDVMTGYTVLRAFSLKYMHDIT